MATVKKLDSFVIKDKYGLTELQVFEEAQASAIRRSEMMGWTDISVVRNSDATFTEGEFTCYTFDLLGADSIPQNENEESKSKVLPPSSSGIAAREISP